jgi:hypothetical protein
MDKDKYLEMKEKLDDLTVKLSNFEGVLKGSSITLCSLTDDVPVTTVGAVFSTVLQQFENQKKDILSCFNESITMLIAASEDTSDYKETIKQLTDEVALLQKQINDSSKSKVNKS